MSRPPGGARYYLAAVSLVGVLVYVPIVDLGVSAGRIHHGVSIAGVDVGGLTEREAEARLRRRVELLNSRPVFFFGPDRSLRYWLDPHDVAWRPQVERSVAEAMRIGREGGLAGAVFDRWRAWMGGVRLRWAGKTGSSKVRAFVDRVEAGARRVGLEVGRAKLRRKIKRGINTWPRAPLRLPVTEN